MKVERGRRKPGVRTRTYRRYSCGSIELPTIRERDEEDKKGTRVLETPMWVGLLCMRDHVYSTFAYTIP